MQNIKYFGSVCLRALSSSFFLILAIVCFVYSFSNVYPDSNTVLAIMGILSFLLGIDGTNYIRRRLMNEPRKKDPETVIKAGAMKILAAIVAYLCIYYAFYNRGSIMGSIATAGFIFCYLFTGFFVYTIDTFEQKKHETNDW